MPSTTTITFDSLIAELNFYTTKKYNFHINNTNLFENALLHLASINETARSSSCYPDEILPQDFLISFEHFSFKTMMQCILALQKKFGENFCRYEKQNQNGIRRIRFSLAAVMQHIGDIKQSIDEILSEPRSLMAYEHYARNKLSPYYSARNYFRAIGKISEFSGDHWIGLVLLTMFDCHKELLSPIIAGYSQGLSYVGKMTDFHFFFNTSEETAKQFIDAINKKFPNHTAARFIRSNAKHSWLDGTNFCEVIIDTDLLCSNEFQSLFQEAVNNLLNDLSLSAQLRKQTDLNFDCCNVDFKPFLGYDDWTVRDMCREEKIVFDESMSQSSFEKSLRNAAYHGKWSLVRALCKFVININAQDTNVGRTALHCAGLKGHKDCYDLLIALGADPTIKAGVKNDGKTAAEYLQEHSATDNNNVSMKPILSQTFMPPPRIEPEDKSMAPINTISLEKH